MNGTFQPAAISRRRLLKLASTAALAAPGFARSSASPNNTVRVALVGCGLRAQNLARLFSRLPEVAIVALSDADSAHMEATVQGMAKHGVDLSAAAKHQDYRKLLENREIDAVVVASPNHWHALHAIDAMRAGKDVYVEKPVTHSWWEGRQLVAAVQKYGRILAAGFQSRSDPGPRDGFQFVREGNLGRILGVHICCFKDRVGVGKRTSPLVPPATCDYNLWLGPAIDQPLYRDEFHYDWHWFWHTGNGEIGNQAPHEIDLTNRLLGATQLPAAIHSCGGRFAWNDAGETPNMQMAWYELAGVPVIIEVNDLKVNPERKVSPVREGIRVGLLVRCEGGQLRGGLGGMYAVAPDGKTILRKFPGDGGAQHQANFIAAVRSRRAADIASPVDQAERAAAIAHLANLSIRAGSPAGNKALDEAIGDRAGVRQILAEHSKQLAAWGITEPVYTLGRQLAIEPASGRLLTADLDPALVRPPCRPEFAIPDLA